MLSVSQRLVSWMTCLHEPIWWWSLIRLNAVAPPSPMRCCRLLACGWFFSNFASKLDRRPMQIMSHQRKRQKH